MAHFFEIDDLSRQRGESGKLYLEFLRVPAMSAGVYVLPKGATDPQKPHREDEMYYVVRGRARMQVGSDHAEVGIGSVIFVEAEQSLKSWCSSLLRSRSNPKRRNGSAPTRSDDASPGRAGTPGAPSTLLPYSVGAFAGTQYTSSFTFSFLKPNRFRMPFPCSTISGCPHR